MIYGIDINDSYKDEGQKRIRFRQGNQDDTKFLESLSAEVSSWDFVVDDGGHFAQDIITSFETLWPHVAPGGVYAIEDIMDGHKKSWGILDYLDKLIREECLQTKKGFTTDIHRVCYYSGGLIFIEKKGTELNHEGRPKNPSMRIGYSNDGPKHPAQVKYHPVWKDEKKPWGYPPYPHKSQHSSSEAHWLYRTTLGLGVGNYVNLGVFRGGSVNCIATALKQLKGGKVYGVDLFEVNGAETVSEVKRVFEERGLLEYAEFCKGYTHEWPEKLKHLKFKMIFIDADHHYETCKKDFELWSPLLEPGGILAFHDVHMTTVERVVDELEGWEQVDHIWRIKSFRRKEDG
jgi:predicted O-methyltransferase YrrM